MILLLIGEIEKSVVADFSADLMHQTYQYLRQYWH
jgi:hypothetical protein